MYDCPHCGKEHATLGDRAMCCDPVSLARRLSRTVAELKAQLDEAMALVDKTVAIAQPTDPKRPEARPGAYWR